MSERPEAEIRVSTIIPVYNGAATVARAIDSALAQDFAGQEIIVVNDGSIDTTTEVLARYDGKIRVIHQPNRGISAARNAGIAIARGKYIALLDDDDEWLAGHLECCAKVLDSIPEAVLCFSAIIEIGADATESLTHPPDLITLQDLLSGMHYVLPSATVMRAAQLKATGGFRLELNGGSYEDILLFLQMARINPLRWSGKTTVRYRCPGFDWIGFKYARGFRQFARIAPLEFGAMVEPLIELNRKDICVSLLTRALRFADGGEFGPALKAFWRLNLCDPTFLYRCVSPRRLFSRHNLARLKRLLSGALETRSARTQTVAKSRLANVPTGRKSE